MPPEQNSLNKELASNREEPNCHVEFLTREYLSSLVRIATDPTTSTSESKETWEVLIDFLADLQHPLNYDFRPVWLEITQHPGKTEILQTFKELPQAKTLAKARTDYQKEQLNQTVELFRQVHLAILETEIKNHFKGEWSLLPNLPPKLRSTYGHLVGWYVEFYEMVRYGGKYILDFADIALKEIKQKIRSTNEPKMLSELASYRAFLESFLKQFDNPQMPLRILRTAIIEMSDCMTEPVLGKGYKFSPAEHKKALRLEDEDIENPEDIELIKKLHQPFRKYRRVTELCLTACEHSAASDEILQKKVDNCRDEADFLGKWVYPSLHTRYARSYTVSNGQKL